MREEYRALFVALENTRMARSCIKGQRNEWDREQAHEGYDHQVAELGTAVAEAVDVLTGDVEARDVEWLADQMVKLLQKRGLMDET